MHWKRKSIHWTQCCFQNNFIPLQQRWYPSLWLRSVPSAKALLTRSDEMQQLTLSEPQKVAILVIHAMPPHTQNKHSDVRKDVTLRSNNTSIYVRVCTLKVHMRSCMFGIATRERRPAARKPGRPRVTRLTNSRAHFRVDTSSDYEDTITTQLAEGVRGMESRESLPRMWKRYDNGFFQRHGARRKGKSRHRGTSTCVR